MLLRILGKVTLITYKSQKLLTGEVAIKLDLLRGFESSFNAAWEPG